MTSHAPPAGFRVSAAAIEPGKAVRGSARIAIRTLLAAMLLSPATALAQFDLAQLQQMVERGNASAAFAYAERYRDEQEGDPAFDYLYGLAAIDSGNASAGVFALERVLALESDNQAARLEMARGYFVLEEYARARAEFELVLQADPPPTVRARIDRFLDAIRLHEGRYRTTAGGFLELGLGSDSNVNSAPDTGDLGGGFQLAEDSQETSDTFVGLLGGGRVSVPFTPATSGFGTLGAEMRAHADNDQFDNHTLNAQGGLLWRRGDHRLQADLQYQSYVFDDDELRNLSALNVDWRLNTSQRSRFSVFGQVASLQYPDQEIRDSTFTTVGAGYSTQFAGRLAPVWFASVYVGDEQPEEDGPVAESVAERSLVGLRVGTQLTLAARSTLRLALSGQTSDYAAPDVTFNEDRDDTYTALSANWTWLIDRTYSVRAHATYARNESGVEFYDFERTQAVAALRAEFN